MRTDAQKKMADDYVAQLDQKHAFSGPIVTKVVPFTGFYPAEDYHQNYLELASGSALYRLQRFAETGTVSERLTRAVPATGGKKLGQPAAARRSSILAHLVGTRASLIRGAYRRVRGVVELEIGVELAVNDRA